MSIFLPYVAGRFAGGGQRVGAPSPVASVILMLGAWEVGERRGEEEARERRNSSRRSMRRRRMRRKGEGRSKR